MSKILNVEWSGLCDFDHPESTKSTPTVDRKPIRRRGIQYDMSRKLRMKLEDREGVTVLNLGEIEIWDGADLSLLRDTLAEIINDDGVRKVGVDLSYVKYIPSGFFGMLFDWLEKGIGVWVYTPQPHVRQMLWFQQFFVADSDLGRHKLMPEPKSIPGQAAETTDTTEWNEPDNTSQPVTSESEAEQEDVILPTVD